VISARHKNLPRSTEQLLAPGLPRQALACRPGRPGLRHGRHV